MSIHQFASGPDEAPPLLGGSECQERGSIDGVDMMLLDAKLSYDLVVFVSDVESDDDEDDTEALMAVLDQIKKEWRGSRSHSNVCLSVFAVLASLLHENLLWSCDEPKVVVATNINPKAVIHDAISATNFYFGMSMIETIDPSNSSVAGRNTYKDTPVKQVECTGKKPRINQVRKLDDPFNEISQIL
ncbi:hypothetical protein DY000_02057361 [Brassica cretica]|uniref:Uncharacterized protein n=1 Tax=Brassica cretica TaxID=69181 RepID=A0ABQ7AG08_BRACR|nr:hypothetical protein DY000_02057361 [Brassica cretica]